jgi:hypothetical protein
MKIYTKDFGEYFRHHSARFFNIVTTKCEEYSEEVCDYEKVDEIIYKHYDMMELSRPHIHHYESINDMYLMIKEYNPETDEFILDMNGNLFEWNGISKEIRKLQEYHWKLQNEIEILASELSENMNFDAMLKCIIDSTEDKEVVKYSKYFHYDINIDKSFIKGKNLSLDQHSIFNFSNRRTIMIDYFFRMSGLYLKDEIKDYLNEQDLFNKSAYDIFGFSKLCVVITKQNKNRYVSPFDVHKVTKNEFLMELFRLVKENPLQINSYYYEEEDVWRFPFSLGFVKMNYTNSERTQCEIHFEERSDGRFWKVVNNVRGKVFVKQPNWTDYPILDYYEITDNKILKNLYLDLFHISKIRHDYINFELKGKYKIFNNKFSK